MLNRADASLGLLELPSKAFFWSEASGQLPNRISRVTILCLFCVQDYWVMLLNLVFSLLAIFHLTYLGSMFDPGLDEQEVEEVRATGG